MSELIKADNEYKEWIAGISTDFRKSQIRASMKINDEMLRFYWKLGKGISSMSEQFGYGMGFYKTVSDDLKSILPDVKSFSPTNLKYMRYFYEMYSDAVFCPQVEDELITGLSSGPGAASSDPVPDMVPAALMPRSGVHPSSPSAATRVPSTT